jgi:hypothetical protein
VIDSDSANIATPNMFGWQQAVSNSSQLVTANQIKVATPLCISLTQSSHDFFE